MRNLAVIKLWRSSRQTKKNDPEDNLSRADATKALRDYQQRVERLKRIVHAVPPERIVASWKRAIG